MIRTDHLESGDYAGGDPHLEELLLDCGVNDSDLAVEHSGGMDDSTSEHAGSPASSSSHKEEQSLRERVRCHQGERIITASSGAHNFELSYAAKRNRAGVQGVRGFNKGRRPRQGLQRSRCQGSVHGVLQDMLSRLVPQSKVVCFQLPEA